MTRAVSARSTRVGWPQRTTAWAGAALLAALALDLLGSAHLAVPLTSALVIPLSGWPVELSARAAFLLGLVVLATGAPGELDAAGHTVRGRACLAAWGAAGAANQLVPALLGSSGTGATVLVVSTGVTAVGALAAIGASITVARARVIAGRTRWVLLPLATCETLITATQDLPLPPTFPVALIPTIFDSLGIARLAALLLAASALLLYGRLEAIKHQAHVIDQNW